MKSKFVRDEGFNMIRKAYTTAGLILTCLVILATSSSSASAVAKTVVTKKPAVKAAPLPPQPSSDGLRVSPVRSDLTIPAGTSQSVQVTVLNLTKNAGPIKPVADDFTAGTNEDGQPFILLNGAKAPSHSLQGFVQPMSQFNLPAGGTYELNVTISIPKGTAAGGYYGAIRFLPGNNAGVKKNVNLTASVGSLILVTVPGKVREQMTIASFDVRRIVRKPFTFTNPNWLYSNNKGLNAVVRFQNSGDIQEEPFGKILLKKGKTVLATYFVNTSVPPGNVLPNSIRLFFAPMTGLGSFGKYTIYGNFGYGHNGQLLSDTYSFYIIPTAVFIALGVLVVLVIILAFVMPRMMRSRNRHKRRQSSRW